MAKLVQLIGYGFMHWCPACGDQHLFYTQVKTKSGALWSFDNNFEQPTFTPSMVITYPAVKWNDKEFPERRCHYILRHGKIVYLGDSTHHLAGRTIDLPDFPG